MKKLFILCACLLTLHSRPADGATEPDVVVVQVAELGTTTDINISRGDGKTETVTIKHKLGKAGFASRGEGLRTVLLNLTREGYGLQAASSEASGFTTYVFVKP